MHDRAQLSSFVHVGTPKMFDLRRALLLARIQFVFTATCAATRHLSSLR
jgi:hypothetical protein